MLRHTTERSLHTVAAWVHASCAVVTNVLGKFFLGSVAGKGEGSGIEVRPRCGWVESRWVASRVTLSVWDLRVFFSLPTKGPFEPHPAPDFRLLQRFSSDAASFHLCEVYSEVKVGHCFKMQEPLLKSHSRLRHLNVCVGACVHVVYTLTCERMCVTGHLFFGIGLWLRHLWNVAVACDHLVAGVTTADNHITCSQPTTLKLLAH